MRFDVAMLSKPGGRRYNEDAGGESMSERGCCLVLADGAGGHGGGDTAARTAIHRILTDFAASPSIDRDALTEFVSAANAAVVDGQSTAPELADMRTTLAMVAVDPATRCAAWCNAGDTRIYLFRSGRMIYRSRDHSVVQEMVDAGLLGPDAPRTHPQRNVLTSGLGGGEVLLNLNEAPVPLFAGDVFLLCTDGFWEYVEEPDMERTLAESADAASWIAAMEPVLLARVPPEHDNYTALAAWVVDVA